MNELNEAKISASPPTCHIISFRDPTAVHIFQHKIVLIAKDGTIYEFKKV